MSDSFRHVIPPVRRIVCCVAIAFATSGAVHAQSTPATQPSSGSWALGIEALALWQKSSPTPAPIITNGILGQANTSVLLGGGDLDSNPAPGFRLTGSYVVSPAWSIDAAFFAVDRRSAGRGVSSSGAPGSTNLLLPYYDVNRNREAVKEISFADHFSGTANEELSNRLMGAEANVSWPLSASAGRSAALFAGFRWLQLEENYSITTNSPVLPPQPVDIWNTSDTFDTSNNFYGVQIGVRGRYDQDRWYATGSVKVALGSMEQKVGISGQLATNDFTGLGATQTFEGGYFALHSNIGNYKRTQFAAVPEIGVGVGYRITPAMSIFAAYNALYASSVVRPGNQISRNINPRQAVSYTGEPVVDRTGPAQPSFSFETSDYWAQSLSVGLEFRF